MLDRQSPEPLISGLPHKSPSAMREGFPLAATVSSPRILDGLLD